MRKFLGDYVYLQFIGIVTIVLAVLGFCIGQLFPLFIEIYVKEQNRDNHELIRDVVNEHEIELDFEQSRALLTAVDHHVNDDFSQSLETRLKLILILLLVATFIAMILLVRKLLESYIEPLNNMTKTAEELAVGNYQARAFAKGPQTINQLRNSINILAGNLQDITKTRAIEEERLKTLIENMGSALLMIDRGGEVMIINRTFLNRFNYQYKNVIGKDFMEINLPSELEEFIDHVFLTELPYREQLTMAIGQEIQYNMAYGAPVVGEHGKWHGVVIVLHDITELIRLEHIRRDFVANVSHELRTPITSIKGFSETLLDGAYKDEEMSLSFLEIIYNESNRLQELITDLLELSKIEQHGFEVRLEPTSMREVIWRVNDIVLPRIEEKNMQLKFEVEEMIVEGDTNRLIQIFTNLIFNACTYSPAGTTVQVKAYAQDGHGVVDVIDQGIGIQKNEIPRIFERFYRVDRARSRNSGGTGLGLAIVKHLIEAHNGKIYVESEVGRGTLMRVQIPLKK